MPMIISEDLKRKCVKLKQSGKTSKEIYDKVFCDEHPGMAYETFRTKLKRWQKMTFADPQTLRNGTYEGFIAHGATVQVDGKGNISQVWVKQHADDNQLHKLTEFIKSNTKPTIVRRTLGESVPEMLEIPLFDQHFPISDHAQSLRELVEVIESRRWEEINIVIGQDMLHNDDMRGRTSSGRPIEKVDMVKAWDMARTFYCSTVESALKSAEVVNLIYSKGNHDESMTWAFVQMLKAAYPQLHVDDSLAQRKCISWRRCFIGITHGAYKKSSMTDLCGQFTIQFTTKFAEADVREIHAGHLHREEDKDHYGIMCRRLSRNGVEDEWSDDEGLVGAHKRFMIFLWKPGRLSAIKYI